MKINSSEIKLATIMSNYDVLACGITKLEAALNDGSFMTVLQNVADNECGGDLSPIVRQLNKNLSSQRCTRRIIDTASANRAKACDLLDAYLHGDTIGKATGKATKASRSGFEYTTDEVERLYAARNVPELQRLYNNVSSNVSKALSGLSTTEYQQELEANPKLANWVAVKALVSERLSAAKKEAKATTVVKVETPTVSEDLKATMAKKLTSGQKKATLTADQLAEIARALGIEF